METANEPSTWAVREQLERLERSPLFSGSDRLLALLRFIVEETLNGGAATLKETVIGNAVYGREPPYDPRIDSTVRVEARRLRRKLDDYYAGLGRADPVNISLPTGGYVPVFSKQSPEDKTEPAREDPDTNATIFERGMGAVVAVMPFRALTEEARVQSFADGLADELMFAMGRAPGIRVISRSVTYQYRDKDYAPASLAQELGVNALLQGTVRIDGDVLRTTIEGSNPKGLVIWSDRFDAQDRDHLRLQERIATTLLSRIQLDSSKMRAMKVGPRPVAVELHAKVYRARRLLDLQTPAALGEALGIFQQVAESAPDSARGHSGIADCYCDMFRLGMVEHAVALAQARAAALRALEIDAESAEAYSAMATISGWMERSRPAAQDYFEKALKHGGNARASRVYGVLMTIMQRHEEAEMLFREAREIEPISSQQDIAEALSHYQAHRYDLLADYAKDGVGAPAAVEALVYWTLGKIFGGAKDQAHRYLAQIGQAVAKLPDLVYSKAEIEAWLGDHERGLRMLQEGNGGATFFARAALAAAVDKPDLACAALEAALDRRELSTVWIRTDPRFDRLRASPRFRALIDRLNAMAVLGDPVVSKVTRIRS